MVLLAAARCGGDAGTRKVKVAAGRWQGGHIPRNIGCRVGY